MKINNNPSSVLAEQKLKAKNKEIESIKPKFDKILESKDKEALKDVARDFEEIFVGMVLKTMRRSVPKSDFTKSSHELEIYEGMLDEAYAKDLAKTGSFGIADMIVKSFEPYLEKEKEAENSSFDSKV